MTLADFITLCTIDSISARSLRTVLSLPTVQALTGSICGITGSIILADALLRAILSKSVRLAIIQTLAPRKSWSTLTHSRYVITIRSVVTITGVFAFLAKHPRRTSIGAHISNPATGTGALARLRIARSIVLAATLKVAVVAYSSLGTLTIRSCPTRSTCTLARDVITGASVLTATELLTFIAILILGALLVTVLADESFATLA